MPKDFTGQVALVRAIRTAKDHGDLKPTRVDAGPMRRASNADDEAAGAARYAAPWQAFREPAPPPTYSARTSPASRHAWSMGYVH
jgi:hypothetical protein